MIKKWFQARFILILLVILIKLVINVCNELVEKTSEFENIFKFCLYLKLRLENGLQLILTIRTIIFLLEKEKYE